jgi:pimeloyl-ACP methyl ester carboxylesterase
MPRIAYQPKDWADQLQFFLETVVQKPVILVVQGALSPVALELLPLSGNLIAGVIFSGPTSWNVTTKNAPRWQQKLLWNLFNSPLGNAFFRYARTRKFLTSFSTDKLFAAADSIDEEWLNTCMTDAQNIAGRYAVFSFLARFWQKDYTQAIAAIQQPTLIVVGDTASSISQAGRSETPDQRLTKYLTYLQKGEGIKVAGRNVLPYESTAQFIAGISPFIAKIS